MNVEYRSNNSGGSWWLSDDDWRKLERAGWKIDWYRDRDSEFLQADSDGRWLGALASGAEKQFPTLREGVEEWQSIVGQDPAEEGCNCCGPPHNFSGTDDEGNYVSVERRVTSEFVW